MSGAPDPGREGVTAVVPAAGSGARMKPAPGDPSKQFRRLGDAPVLVQTLRALAASPEVAALVVVVPEAERESVAAGLRGHGVGKVRAVVAGGETRQASVGNGLAAVETEHVLVHDGVRPFVSADALARVAAAVREAGAAALAVPVADTLRRGAGGRFGETVPRDGVWRMQTPQGARTAWLRDAHARAGELATDEVALLQGAGYPVRIVEGDARNAKLTTPADWALALALWPSWSGAG